MNASKWSVFGFASWMTLGNSGWMWKAGQLVFADEQKLLLLAGSDVHGLLFHG